MGNSQTRQLFEDDAEGEATTISIGEQPIEGPQSPGTGDRSHSPHLSALTQGLEVGPTRDELPDTPQPPRRSRCQTPRTSTQRPLQPTPPGMGRQNQEVPVENAASAAPPPPPLAQANEQEIQAISAGPEQRRRSHGAGRKYARRGSHRGFPGRNTPTVNNSGGSGCPSAGVPRSDPPGDSSPDGSSPWGGSSGSAIESTYSDITGPDDNEDDLTRPGFFLCITGVARFCTRLNGEGEPLCQGWQVANFLSERGRAHGLGRGLRNVRYMVGENREVASLPASTVLTRIANSRPRRPFNYTDHYFNAPYMNTMWAYHIELDRQVLTVYGPPSQTRDEARRDDNFFHDPDEFGPRPGQYPRRIVEYSFNQLLEFDSPEAFHMSVYNSFSHEAKSRYSLLDLYMPDLFNPTELNSKHGDPSVSVHNNGNYRNTCHFVVSVWIGQPAGRRRRPSKAAKPDTVRRRGPSSPVLAV